MVRSSTSMRTLQKDFRRPLRSLESSVLIAFLLCLGILWRVTQDDYNPKLMLGLNNHVPIHSLPSNHNKPSSPRILVTFTGPSEPSGNEKVELYKRNTDHFLKYGVQCHDRDTIIAVGVEYFDLYYPKVKAIRDSQCTNGHFVHLVSRRPVCYDMETVRLIVTGGIAGVDWDDYDYFVYLNCGVTGPHPQFQHTWLQIYLSKLKAPVHMTGLSVNCYNGAHVQSMLYAVDRVGMDLIKSTPYDCILDSRGTLVKMSEEDLYIQVIARYERGMAHQLFRNGYAIAPATLQSGVVLTNTTKCALDDMWFPEKLSQMYGGRLPLWNETIFWKSSRFLTPEIQKIIGYEGKTKFRD